MSLLLALLALQSDSVCEVKLVTSSDVVQPETEYHYAIEFNPKPGWHIYWKNPGDSGVAPTIKWDLPDGWKATDFQFPAPTLFEEDSMVTYGYAAKTTVVGTLKVPKLDMSKSITLNGVVNWMACQDSCLTGTSPVTMTLRPALGSAYKPEFVKFVKSVHQPSLAAEAKTTTNGYLLQVKFPKKPDSAYFYPDTPGVVAHTKLQEVKSKDGTTELALTKSEFATGNISRLTGVLEVKSGDKVNHYSINALIAN